MRLNVVAVVCGSLFGAGLAAAGMTDPAKIIAFLDLFGAWNPALIAVMASAVVTTFMSFQFIFRRSEPLLDTQFHLPTLTEIDKTLVVGATLFGIGWGLYGYCPGPALGALVYGHIETVIFVAAMIVGMTIHRFTFARNRE